MPVVTLFCPVLTSALRKVLFASSQGPIPDLALTRRAEFLSLDHLFCEGWQPPSIDHGVKCPDPFTQDDTSYFVLSSHRQKLSAG